MKKGFTNLMAALVLLLGGAISSNAQTTLSAGDIAFIGLYMDGLSTAGDGFTFILLKNIDAGTVIYFTDEGWDATNNAWYGNSNDAHFTWTAPAGGSTAGKIVHIQNITATTYSTTLGEVSSTLNGVWNLSSSGDQVLAYQSNAVRPATPTFIAAVDADYYTGSTYDGTDGWGSSYYAVSYVSDLPPGLTNGVNCVALVNASQPTEYDNYKYNGTLTGTTNDIRAAINSYTNWTRNDDGTLDIGASAYSAPNITIPATAPTVTTQAVSSITSTTATGNGNITALGSPNPTQYGVVWSTSTNPTIALTTKTTEGSSSSTGAFSASMTGLSEGTTYYVRAYATNTAGTSYGAEVSFTTQSTPTITWANPTDITYGTLLSATQLNATTSVPGIFTYTPALGEKLSAGAAQNLKVDFTPTDAALYLSTSKTVTINVNKATPVITWESPTGITYGTLLSATQLNATADVPGTMVYTPATGAKLNAGTAQDLQVSFTPTDDTNYSSATKTVTIDVSKATPVITWEDPDDISKGMALSATQLNATADVVGSFVYIPDFGTVLSTGANQSLLVEFAPTDTLNYSNETKTVLITVNSTVGISKAKNSAFRVYLNPTVDLLRIDGLTERAVLTITDLNGRVFMNEEIENNQSVSTSSLPKGAYLANILTKGISHAIMFFKK